jgi:hypothetical protein
MYSPYDAVFGHDKTHIQRMTVEEYMRELQEEEADVRSQSLSQHTPTPPAQQQENHKSGVGASSPRTTPPAPAKARVAAV